MSAKPLPIRDEAFRARITRGDRVTFSRAYTTIGQARAAGTRATSHSWLASRAARMAEHYADRPNPYDPGPEPVVVIERASLTWTEVPS